MKRCDLVHHLSIATQSAHRGSSEFAPYHREDM